MAASDDAIAGYLQLLDLVEDYFRGGFRRRHLARAATPVKSILGDIGSEIAVCTRCPLHAQRQNSVAGYGVPNPLVLVVGEGPGEEEDKTGRPFVGPAGKYLDKWLEAIGLSRDENCYIANVVKCRPPRNRDPEPTETAACLPYLDRQVDALAPKAILSVGRIASQILSGKQLGIGVLRGTVCDYRGMLLVPTFHPSAVLRNKDLRRLVWEDLKVLKSLLEQ